MKSLIYFLFFLGNFCLYAQVSDTLIVEIKNIDFTESNGIVNIADLGCPYTIGKAKEAIEKDELVLVHLIGFRGIGNMNLEQTRLFAEKYNIRLESLGCVRFWDMEDEDVPGFNDEIVNFLCLKYGLKVRIEYNELFSEPSVN